MISCSAPETTQPDEPDADTSGHDVSPFPVRESYVTIGRVGGEGAIGSIVYGGILYGVYAAASRK